LPDWAHSSTFWIVQIVMLVGLFGLIIPIFSGIVVIWLAALGYGIVIGFTPLGTAMFVGITLLMLLGTIVDNLLMGAGARQGGASWLTIGVALLAGVVGTILFPPLGGLIAAPLAVFIVEYFRHRNWRIAWHALVGLAAGWGAAFVVRFGIGVVMIVLWWLWVWKG
jgi:uncharacterized protein YqgC (DUF456 family)